MSSSVFLERNLSETTLNSDDDCAVGDLVVVYVNHNGSVDHDDIKMAMERKAVSTLSVVRVTTSPTLSMVEEEKARTNAENENSTASESNDLESSDEALGLDDNSHSEDNSNDDGRTRVRRRRSERRSNALAKKSNRNKRHNKPEDIVLTIENFYTSTEATNMLKHALKKAGMPVIKQSDHDDQMYVIHNDHCYTAHSAEQLRQLHAVKFPDLIKDAPRQPQTPTTNKQIVKRKPMVLQQQQTTDIRRSKELTPSPKVKPKVIAVHKVPRESPGSNDRADKSSLKNNSLVEEDDNDEEEKEMSELDSAEEKVDTDNDRASDVDFRVNNRNVKKKKVLKTRKQALMIKTKQPQQQNTVTTPKVNTDTEKILAATPTVPQKIVILNHQESSPKVVALPEVKPRTFTIVQRKPQIDNKPMVVAVKKPIVSIPTIRKGTVTVMPPNIIKKYVTIQPQRQHQPAAPQRLKEITINTVLASPKGGFTNISSLLSEDAAPVVTQPSNTATPSKKPVILNTLPAVAVATSPSSIATPPKVITPLKMAPAPAVAISPAAKSKGFVPLGTDAATNHELPAQISIQTHQSTSELASEHDKQLDLIDSIVQGELQNASTQVDDAQAINENIPKLVKMLESTESAPFPLDSMDNIDTNDTTKDMSINSSCSMLDADEHNIPADLLKQIGEIVEGEPTLLKQVEVLNQKQEQKLNFLNLSETITTPIIERNPQKFSPAQQQGQSKSIIELAISNVVDLTPTICKDNVANIGNIQTPLVNQEAVDHNATPRIESKQIVRGGRIIILPPIEAPTTRAKRRAQTQPDGSTTPAQTPELSSMTPQALPNVHEDMNDNSANYKKRRVSKESSKKKADNSRRSVASIKGNTSREENSENSESQDDDDPNKLWCVCRQPHNNRFMICCDVCEDWFHGTCVNITKAMGKEIELKGIDWTCPICIKKQEEKTQRKITDMLKSVKPDNTKLFIAPLKKEPEKSTSESSTPKRQNTDIHSKKQPMQTGQFISLKELDNFNINSPITVTRSDQKKQTTTTPSVGPKAKMHTQSTPISGTPQQKGIVIYRQHHHQHTLLHRVQQEGGEEKTPNRENACIECKKGARPNSNYCSDECIKKYTQNALQAFSDETPKTPGVPAPVGSDDQKLKRREKQLFEDTLLMADLKQKVERVNVFERSSGRFLTGSNAPTTANLKKWLLENPTYEVIQPGSDLETKLKQRPSFNASNASTPISRKFEANFNTPNRFVTVAQPSPIKHVTTKVKTPANNAKTFNTPKQLQKYPAQVHIKPDKLNKEKAPNRQSSDVVHRKEHKDSPMTDTEPQIRSTVRRVLNDLLCERIKEIKVMRESGKETEDQLPEQLPTDEEIQEFANKTEKEMYKYYHYDTGLKYKVKYRSLTFNIKDRKNCTLLAKICGKLVEPKQLVQMTPAELASQELTRWRENEQKHQLEIIKKTELDMLALLSKSRSVKTHKGETVIDEEEKSPILESPALVAEELLNCPEPIPETVANRSKSPPAVPLVKDVAPSKTEEKSHSKDRERRGEHDRERRHRSKDHHHKSSKRSSGDRSRSRSHEKRSKTSHKDEKHRGGEHRERDREHSHERSKDREREQDVVRSHKHSREHHEHKHDGERSLGDKKPKTTHTNEGDKEKHRTQAGSAKKQQVQTFDLIDKILESSKTIEEAANILPQVKSVPTPQHHHHQHQPQQQSEPIDIINPECVEDPLAPYARYCDFDNPIWSGITNLFDVASFSTIIVPAVGNSVNLGNLLPTELEVVGRIEHNQVWDYMSKIQKTPSKEIVLVRLVPQKQSEMRNYTTLYQYLYEKNRLAVVKMTSLHIKDFYIFPLKAGKKMPPLVQPDKHVEFYEDTQHPDMLIGLVVRIIGKKSTTATPELPAHVAMKYQRKLNEHGDSFTPPGSPMRKRYSNASATAVRNPTDDMDIDAIIKAPITSKLAKPTPKFTSPPIEIRDDDDEPYSPRDSSEDDDVPAQKKPRNDQTELSRKMDELNRKIAAQEMEIAGLLKVETRRPIASNLPQILQSIMQPQLSVSSTPLVRPLLHATTKPVDEYVPVSYTPKVNTLNQPSPSTSRLAQLSEAELLRMVPDDMLDETLIYHPRERQTTTRVNDEPPPPGV